MRFGTKAIHGGIKPDPTTGAVMTPIFQTTTYAQKSPGVHQGYEYSRTQNPTRDVLQNNIAQLENARHGICFASGLAAIDAIVKLLKTGDEVISTNDLYGGSYRLFETVYSNFGIKFHFTPVDKPENVLKHVNEKTRLIWIESPTNPMLNIIDIRGVAEQVTGRNILIGVDNTFASPYLQNPLDLGADIVMHSVTKYIGGHSDVVMGALACNDDELAERLGFLQNASGAVPGPQDCFLVLRGIKTMHIRMQRHCENARVIANYLKENIKVDRVLWPGFESHPNHHVAKKQMRDFGGMISFCLKEDTREAAFRVLENFKIFLLAESLGGVESLCGHPASMTHASIPKKEREKTGLTESMIRLSVGIEDVEDLVDDLDQALG